jgi:hypothetical protein
MELLRDYDRQGLEEAFAALVQQHINLVNSAALRHVGIAAHAEEITQAVLLEKSPADLVVTTNRGRVELRFDKMLPPPGKSDIRIRYRLNTATR